MPEQAVQACDFKQASMHSGSIFAGECSAFARSVYTVRLTFKLIFKK
jgi:hypothetical protein